MFGAKLKYLRQNRQSRDIHSLVGVVVSRRGLGVPLIAPPALHVSAARQALRLHRVFNYLLRRLVLRNQIAQLLPDSTSRARVGERRKCETNRFSLFVEADERLLSPCRASWKLKPPRLLSESACSWSNDNFSDLSGMAAMADDAGKVLTPDTTITTSFNKLDNL